MNDTEPRGAGPATDSPESAEDQALRRALEDANIPTLMNALVHLTGDLGLIRGTIRPNVAEFVDLQCGISPELQQEARDLAFDILRRMRDQPDHALPELQDQEIEEMVSWMVGVPLPAEYTRFLVQELAMDGEDPYHRPSLAALPRERKESFHVLIVGAGMSGLLAAHRLLQAGVPFTVVDKNSEVGGTWFENSYPGCRVDSPNHSYSYSFKSKDWPMFYSPRQVLRDYFNHCADEFGIRENIRLGTELRSAQFDPDQGSWRALLVHEVDGKEVEEELLANVIISAVGQLNRPKLPDIEGRDSFEGPAFHSARWQDEVDLAGRRVGVIGTGASAFQLIPEVAKTASHVSVFQRTPPWVRPTPDYHSPVPDGKHWLLNNVPFYAKWFRFLNFWLTAEGMLEAAKTDPAWDNGGLSVSQANEELRQLLLQNLEAHLADHPDLLAKATPKYPPAGKRMLFDNGTWLEALKRDNVELITDPVSSIDASGVNTAGTSGQPEHHNLDVVIFGTGFETSRMLGSMDIRGRDGQSLSDLWQDDPRAYLGITVPGFPNFFCLYGPNTNIVVNGSIIFFTECEVRYILGCIETLIEGNHQVMECRPEVCEAYIERIDEGNRAMAWGSDHVQSWYKNSAGRVTQNWPFSLVEYWLQTRDLDPADYQFS